MKRLLLFALTAGLLSPIAAKAEFVFPWNKIEPNYSSYESAMRACERGNEHALKGDFIKQFIESSSFSDTYLGKTTTWFTDRKVLSTQCKVYSTKDPNIGEIRGNVSWLETKYQDGELRGTPTVESVFTYHPDIYYPYKNK